VKTCPQCHQNTLLEMLDSSTGFVEHACPVCGYYDSNSPAYTMCPELFCGLGTEVISRLRKCVSMHGMTESEAEGWITQEPHFTRRIATPLESSRKGDKADNEPTFAPKRPRDKLTP
jgi:hypothetical protein